MQIELKNTDFKYLYELCNKVFCKGSGWGDEIRRIIVKDLKPQYEKAFLKYQNEKQEFKVRQRVKFHWPNDTNWWEGTIYKVSRLASGQYKYVIKYKDENEYNQLFEKKYSYTNPMTKKNIRLIKV